MGTSEKHSKVYVESIMRADGEARLRARWTDPITGKPQNKILGFVSDFPGWNKKTKPANLQNQLDLLQVQVNKKPITTDGYTMNDLIKEFLEDELVLRQPGEDVGYSWSYIVRTRPVISRHIQPAWGHHELQQLGTMTWEIEKWVGTLKQEDGTPLSKGSKAKVKYTMQAIFRYAVRRQRYNGMNPLTAFKQEAKREYNRKKDGPRTLTVEQFDQLVSKLEFLPRLLVLFATTTGLRRSEIQALRWSDIDFLGCSVDVERGFVDGVVGDTKSEASQSSVPLNPEVVEMLKAWRQMTSHSPDDYVFTAVSNRAGKERKGKTPLCLTRYFVYHIQPVANELGIKVWRFGWHSFRRTFVTWLAAANDNPKTVMQLARHATFAMTMDVYAELEHDKSKEAHAKGLSKLSEILTKYSQTSLCVADINSAAVTDGVN